MVKLTNFLPDRSDLNQLTRLNGVLTLSRRAHPIGGTSTVFVNSPERGVSITTRYCTIVFKFEIFGLFVEPLHKLAGDAHVEVMQVSEWDRIRYLARYEWQRPAVLGEVPAGYRLVVGESGRKKNIPANVTALGVSLVGTVLWNTASACPRCIISIDEVDGNIIKVLDASAKMLDQIDNCDLIELNELESYGIL